jgi:hypothetical protein
VVVAAILNAVSTTTNVSRQMGEYYFKEAKIVANGRAVVAKVRQGTEVLRTGGGITLTAKDCNELIEYIEHLRKSIGRAYD